MHRRSRLIKAFSGSVLARRPAAAAAGVLGLLSALAAPASAFCPARTCNRATENCVQDQNGCLVTGEPLAWRRRDVSVAVDPAGSARLGITAAQTAEVLQRAFDSWQQVSCPLGGRPSLSLRVADPRPGAMNEGDALVTYVDTGWTSPKGYGAITELTVDGDTGAIEHALLHINSETHALAIDAQAPAVDLQAVLTHEVGHLIGLDHSRVPGATMVAETQAFGTSELRSLDADDIAGVCALYPVREPEPRSSDSGSSCAASPAPPRAGTRTLASCVVVAGLLYAARRRAAVRVASEPRESIEEL